MPLLPHRLNTRIILVVSFILLVTGITSGWVTAKHQAASLLTTMRLNSAIMARNIADNSARQLLVQDYADLETLLLKSAELSDIKRLQVCEPNGTLIWDVTRIKNGQPHAKAGIARITPPVSRAAVVVTDNDQLIFWQPIMAGSLLGWLKADFSLSAIKNAQADILKHTLLLTITWVICNALLIILVLRPIVQSIGKISTFAKGLDKQKGEQLSISGQPLEIAELGASLNEASSQLFATEQQLLKERERLQKSEENYRRLLDTIQEGIWVIDANAVTTFVNPRMAEILGYTTDEMIGRHLYTFMDEQGILISEENIDRRKRGIKEQHDFEFIRKDGQRILTRLETGPIVDDEGNYAGSIAAVADISEQRRAELQLKASEQAFRAVVENSPDVIVRYDRDGSRIYVNPEFERVNHLSAEEALGKTPVEISTELAPMADVFMEQLMAAMASGAITKIDLSWTKNGKSLCWFVRVVPEFDANGTVVSALTIWSDITERKQAEEEISKLNEELEQRVAERTADLDKRSAELSENQQALINIVKDLNEKSAELEQANIRLKEVDRLKSMFIASMSHELRTPLNSIIGFSSILRDGWIGPVNAEQQENLAIILRSGKHLLNLINDVIDVSKIEAGRIEALPQQFDLFDLVQEGITYVDKEIKEKGLDLRLENIHLQIFTDRQRLLQCLLNLLSNAIKFTEQGSITVEAQLVQAPGKEVEESVVEISVTDTGIGIKPEDLTRMFQPFVRLVPPGQTTVPGTGLGLYLTRKLAVEVLNGDILLSSEYGKGSHFIIRMPVRIS